MASPYAALGLEYNFTDKMSLGVGLMNNAVDYNHPLINPGGINLTKTIYAKFD